MERNEEIEQARLVKWTHKSAVRALMPKLAFLHHSPNGGKRSAFTGAQMKALGTKAGFPDLILPVRRPQHTGLVIEMKAEKGVVSDSQKPWLEHFTEDGWLTMVCRSAQDARTIICQYFGIDPNEAPPLDS